MSAHVGVKTRAQAALAMEAAATSTPKRKNNSSGEEDGKSSKSPRTSSSSDVKQATENVPPETKERCLSRTSGVVLASCCCSNESTGLGEDKIKLLDLEVDSAQVETSICNGGQEIERKIEMSRSSEVRENAQERHSMESNSRRHSSTARIMPTDLELDEFFAAAEKDIQKKFLDKYNYDVVKDEPLEGRYEWVQVKP